MHLSTLWYGDILIPFMSVQWVWAVSTEFAFVACGLYDSIKSAVFLFWVSRPHSDSCSSFVVWEVASSLRIDTCFRICLLTSTVWQDCLWLMNISKYVRVAFILLSFNRYFFFLDQGSFLKKMFVNVFKSLQFSV